MFVGGVSLSVNQP